ncbi:Sorting nexin-21 [Sarcoptes scabiei]|uniref:Sorting nexin-21 n=1 Tax=Sarcoptes scabiei TaxID=52283 RepID=A0A834R936_SARSC|nr:Sorting nexin-21 [Sarcoptes scabiei]UXI19151.1 regulation of nuclear pre-mRNA domain-containing protein 1B [Sarcoptes scabiei]
MNEDSRNDKRSDSRRNKSNFLFQHFASDEENDNDDDEDDERSSGRIEITQSNQNLISTSSKNECDDINGVDSFNSTNHSYHRNSYDSSTWNDSLVESTSPRRSHYRVLFEVIKARTLTGSDRKRFVKYTILMKRTPGLETEPAVIERRYNDFRCFYNSIRRKFPLLFKDIYFPKKIFIGNFSAEVIAERSMAFQKFLTYCLSLAEIRSSKELASFLFYPELNEAKNLLKKIQLEEAANLFENVYFIQSKLLISNGRPNGQLIHTLCCLIGCLNAIDNTTEAKKLASKIFELLLENPVLMSPSKFTISDGSTSSKGSTVYEIDNLFESSPLIIPLILLSLRHGWFSGSQKSILEMKLEELCRKHSLPRNFDSHPKLLEIILRKDFATIL